MKYCVKCGAELNDNDVFCPKCGAKVGEEATVQPEPEPRQEVVSRKPKRDSGIMTVALVFCIISCVVAGWAIIPLCWMIPMTVSLNGKIQRNEPISVGFKVCTLLFLSLIGGILLLVGDEND